IAFPTSDLSTGTNTGYNIGVLVGYKPQAMPISVRAEVAYNQFGFTNGGGSINIPSFTGNVVYELPLGVGFTPYAIGGAGLYRPSTGFNGVSSNNAENDFGWNIGGGIKLPLSTGFETYIEARYNSVNVSGGGTASFVPLTVGILF